MAKSDIDLAKLRREEGALSAFFDAERAEPAALPEAFLRAVLADAARAAAPRAPRPAPRRVWPDLAALLRPVGGWAGASALAGCLALGLWAGTLGAGGDLVGGALWTDLVTLDEAADGVGGFFDLETTEG